MPELLTITVDTSPAQGRVEHIERNLISRGALRMIGARVRDWLRAHAPARPGRRDPRPRWKKLKASFSYRLEGRDTVVIFTKNPKGVWYERGTSAHAITASGRILRIPTATGVIYRRSVKHPGQPPRRLFPTPAEAAEVAQQALEAHVRRVVHAAERKVAR